MTSSTGRSRYDVVVVGSGPNGLAAAIVLARAGLATLVVEACDTPGGGARTTELAVPGVLHDACSTVHPLGVASPFFRSLGLERHGLEWVHSPSALAHVLDDGRAVLLERSLDDTARGLGRDGDAYRALLEPFVARFDELMAMILAPLRVPSSPVLAARFGLVALRSMQGLARRFATPDAPALLGGIAAHAMLPLDAVATASFALVLTVAAHAVGWPLARGGSQAITDALLACLREAGGELELGQRVARLRELPAARAYVFDVTPRQLVTIADGALPLSYRRRVARFRYGAGVCKVDWVLRGPVPWRDPACARAATVHLGGDLNEVAFAENAVHAGGVAERPFVLFVQPTAFDAARAPSGLHVGWAYCHVPHASSVDATAAIEAQIERFAPGFGDLVLARTTRNARAMEAYDENYVGGDINGGAPNLAQLFFRPIASPDPYATGAPNIFLCSSSTPPGGGVHGMCGAWAARSVLARVFGQGTPVPTRPATSRHAATPAAAPTVDAPPRAPAADDARPQAT